MKNKFGEQIDGIQYQERVGVYGIVCNADGFIVAKVNDGYFLVGGGLEEEESHHECLRREFLEEIGYTIEICEYLGVNHEYHQSFRSKTHYELIGHCYIVKLIKRIGQGEADHKLVSLKASEIDRMTLEYQSQVMKQVVR